MARYWWTRVHPFGHYLLRISVSDRSCCTLLAVVDDFGELVAVGV